MKNLLILIGVLLIISGCTKDEETPAPGPETIIEITPLTGKSIDTVFSSNDIHMRYTFDENKFLKTWTTTRNTGNSSQFRRTYNYDAANRITSWRDVNEATTQIRAEFTYSYDEFGRISSILETSGYSQNTRDFSVTYEGNTATYFGDYQGITGVFVNIEFSNEGRITRISSDGASIALVGPVEMTFSYDDRGNIRNYKRIYSPTGEIMYEANFQHDNNPNAHYGQFQSIYLERFVEMFFFKQTRSLSGFSGYNDTFFNPNNIISQTSGGGGFETETIQSVITYDNEDYPVYVEVSTPNVSSQYEITYLNE